MFEQASRCQAADSDCAHDQGRLGQLAVAAGLELRPVQRGASGGDVDGAECPEPKGLRREVLDAAGQEDPKRDERHRGERGGRHDQAHVVQNLQADVPGVEASEVEGQKHDGAVGHEPDGRRADDAGAGRSELRRERGGEQHRGVEEDTATRPGGNGRKSPGCLRARVPELDRLEYRKRLCVRQRSRGHVAACRSSVCARLYGRATSSPVRACGVRFQQRAATRRPQPSDRGRAR